MFSIKNWLVSKYQRSVECRDWLLAKVQYLQGESAKWKAAIGLVKLPYYLVKGPYSGLRALGLNPQMAVGFMAFSSTVVGGVVVNETILSEYSFRKGDSGVYLAPGDIPVFHSGDDNTLKVILATTTVGELSISDITVGTAFAGSTLPAGETSAIIVGGDAAAGTFLEVGHLVLDRWRCDSFLLKDTESRTINVRFNVSDGHSITQTPGTPRARGIGGGNRASEMVTSGGTYDQIKVHAPEVDGKVGVLRLSNLFTKGGSCVVSRIKADIIDVEYMETGVGDGFGTKEFVIDPSTVAQDWTVTNNVEVTIPPP